MSELLVVKFEVRTVQIITLTHRCTLLIAPAWRLHDEELSGGGYREQELLLNELLFAIRGNALACIEKAY
jgi:hypothetical protein